MNTSVAYIQGESGLNGLVNEHCEGRDRPMYVIAVEKVDHRCHWEA